LKKPSISVTRRDERARDGMRKVLDRTALSALAQSLDVSEHSRKDLSPSSNVLG
jgi:hypothetical protein